MKQAFRKLVTSMLGLVLLLSLLELHSFATVEQVPDDATCPFALRIDGVNYIYRGGDGRPELSHGDVELLGVVGEETAPRYAMPEEDGQANFGAGGSPYGVAADGEYVFFYEDCWRPLVEEEEYNESVGR